jgi:hypothetical protein
VDLRDSLLGELEILGDIEGLSERDFADEMMGRSRSQFGGRLGRENVETLVDLKSIRTDDFAMATFRYLDRDVGFPDRSRTGDDEEGSGG